MIGDKQVIFVEKEYLHHGHHSGYRKLVDCVPHEFHFTSMDQPDHFTFCDKLYYKLPGMHPNWYNKSSLKAELKAFQKILIGRKAVVVHFLYGENSYRWSGYPKKMMNLNARLVATYHQIPGFFEKRRSQFSHVQYLDAVVVVSNCQKPFFDGLINPEKVFFIPHGIDTHYFRPLSYPDRVPLICLSVGTNYRDDEFLLKLINGINLNKRREIYFKIVGNEVTQKQFAGLENTRHYQKISDQELLALYQNADLLLLPVKDFTASNALLEGMACGLPVAISDIGGVKDYVDSECAIFLDSYNIEESITRILDLFKNYEKRVSMGKHSRELATTRFDWGIISGKINNMYGIL